IEDAFCEKTVPGPRLDQRPLGRCTKVLPKPHEVASKRSSKQPAPLRTGAIVTAAAPTLAIGTAVVTRFAIVKRHLHPIPERDWTIAADAIPQTLSQRQAFAGTHVRIVHCFQCCC